MNIEDVCDKFDAMLRESGFTELSDATDDADDALEIKRRNGVFDVYQGYFYKGYSFDFPLFTEVTFSVPYTFLLDVSDEYIAMSVVNTYYPGMKYTPSETRWFNISYAIIHTLSSQVMKFSEATANDVINKLKQMVTICKSPVDKQLQFLHAELLREIRTTMASGNIVPTSRRPLLDEVMHTLLERYETLDRVHMDPGSYLLGSDSQQIIDAFDIICGNIIMSGDVDTLKTRIFDISAICNDYAKFILNGDI